MLGFVCVERLDVGPMQAGRAWKETVKCREQKLQNILKSLN